MQETPKDFQDAFAEVDWAKPGSERTVLCLIDPSNNDTKLVVDFDENGEISEADQKRITELVGECPTLIGKVNKKGDTNMPQEVVIGDLGPADRQKAFRKAMRDGNLITTAISHAEMIDRDRKDPMRQLTQALEVVTQGLGYSDPRVTREMYGTPIMEPRKMSKRDYDRISLPEPTVGKPRRDKKKSAKHTSHIKRGGKKK